MAATKRGKPKPKPTKQATVKAAAKKATRKATIKPPPKKRAPRPVTEKERAQARKLAAEGVARNEIARRLKRSAATITKIIREAGQSFDRSQTAEATAARVEDMKARRLEIAELLLADVPKLHERLWSPHRYYERGPDAPIEMELPLPPLRDVRDGYGAIGLALRGHQDMMRESSTATVENKRSVLGDLIAGLKAAYDADKAAEAVIAADAPGADKP